MRTQEEVIGRIFELIESIETQLEAVRELVSIAFVNDEATEHSAIDEEILVDASEVDQEEEDKKPAAKPKKLTNAEKRSLVLEARVRAQLWAQEERAKIADAKRKRTGDKK